MKPIEALRLRGGNSLLLCMMLALVFNKTQAQTITSTPSLVNDTAVLCLGGKDTVRFSASGSTAQNFTWDFGGGSPSSTSGRGPIAVHYSTAGVAQVRAYVSTSGIYTDTLYRYVKVGQPHPVAFMPSDTAFCTTDAPFMLNGVSPAGGYFAGPGVSNGRFDPSVAGVGNHTLWYIFEDGSCLDSASVRVNVKSASAPNLLAQGTPTNFNGKKTYTRCVPASSVFNFYTTTAASQYIKYSIDFGDGQSQSGSTFPSPFLSHSYSKTGIFDAVLSVTNANGCISTDTIRLFYGSNPSVGLSIKGNNIKCLPRDSSGHTFAFPISNISSNPPGTVYIVEVNDGSPPAYYNHPPPDSILHTFYEPSCGYNTVNFNNAFQVKITASTPCQPNSVATVEPIFISDPPTAAFSVEPRVCFGKPVTISDESWGSLNALTGCDTNVTLVWEISPSTYTVQTGFEGSLMGSNNPMNWLSGTEDLTVNFTKTGYYTIRQYVGNQAGCEIDTVTKVICVDSIPKPDFAIDKDTLCSPDTVNAHFLHNLVSFCDTTALQWSVVPNTGHRFLTDATDSATSVYFYQSGVYNISILSSNLCDTVTASRTIVVQGPPDVSLPPDEDFCGLNSIDFSNPSYAPTVYDSLAPVSHNWQVVPASGWSFSNGSASSAGPEINFQNYGHYQVIYTATNTCGIDSDTIEFNFYENPEIVPPADTLVCYNSSVSKRFSAIKGAGGYSYQWRTAGGSYQPGDSIFLANLKSTTNIELRVVDSLGCLNTDTFSIFVADPLIANAGPNVEVCYYDTVQLSGSASGSIPGYTYTWSPATALSDTSIANPLRYPTRNSISYTLTVTDSLGCSTTDVVEVEVFPIINVTAGKDMALCYDNTLHHLNAHSPKGGSWSGPGLTDSIFDPIAAGLGQHQLIYSYRDANGCGYSDTMNINVINIPEAEFTMSAPGCTPLNVQVFDSSSTGVNHFWYINDSLASTAAQPNFSLVNNSLTADSTYQVKLVVTAGTGCRDSITKSITVYPGPKAGFVQPASSCGNDSIQLVENSVYGGGSATYQWRVKGALATLSNDTARAPLVILGDNHSGVDSLYRLQLVLTTANGCTDTAYRSFWLYSRPIADFNLPQKACSPLALTPVDSSSGTSLSYSWSVEPSVSISRANAKNPVINLPLSTSDSVRYKISLEVTDSRGCVDTLSKIYWVYPQPTAAFSPSINDSCGPLSIAFNNQSSSNISGQNLSDLSFEWDFGNGQTSTDSVPSASFTNTGVNDSSYVVWLKVTNQFGCTDSTSDTITVHPDPVAQIDTNFSAACAPFLIDQNLASASHYSFANQEYYWRFLDMQGNMLHSDTGRFALNYSITNPADSIILELVVSSPFGCKNDTDRVVLHTLSNPEAIFSALPSSGCSPLEVHLQDSSTTGVNHKWYLNGQLFSSQQNPVLNLVNNSAENDSVVSVLLAVNSASGCTDSTEQFIMIHPVPAADFSLPASLCPGDTAYAVNQSQAKVGSQFYWSVNSSAVSISNDTAAAPLFTFPDNQSGADSTYTITLAVLSPEGCADTSTRQVKIFDRPVAGFQMPAKGCGPLVINPIDTASGGTLSYLWKVSPAISIQGQDHHTPTFEFPVSFSDSVVYTITQVVTNANGCLDSTQRTYSVYPRPTAAFTASAPDTCGPVTISFNNLSFSGQSGMDRSSMSFSWDFGNGLSSTDSVPSVSFTNNGTTDSSFVIRLIATNVFGCVDTAFDTITLHPRPIANISYSQASSCAPFVLDSSVVNARLLSFANDNYYWEVINSAGTIVAQDSGFDKLSYTITQAADSVRLRLTATSPFGCESDTSIQLFYTYPDPVADFTPVPASSCSPLRVSVADSSSTGNKEWFVNDSLYHTGANPNFVFTNSSALRDSVVDLKLVVTSANGCTDTLLQQVTIHPNPIARFSVLNSSCPGDTLFVADSSLTPAGTSYRWTVSGKMLQLSSDTAQNPALFIGANQSGYDSTFVLKLAITTPGGCIDSTQKMLTIFSRPLADFTMPAAACAPVINNPMDASSGRRLQYQWSVSPSINIQGAQHHSPTFDFPASFSDSVRYKITLRLTDSITGCSDTAVKYYTVYPRPAAAFAASKADSCGPHTISFFNQSSPNQAGMDRRDMSFAWDFGNGQTSSDSLPTITFTNSGSVDSIFVVQLIASNAFGCADTAYDTIRVHPSPQAVLNFSNSAGCAPFVIDSSVVSAQILSLANDRYYWEALNTSGTIIAQDSSLSGFNHVLTQPEDSIYLRLTATSPYGCQADTSIQLFYTINNPVAKFTPVPQQGCSPMQVSVLDSASPGAQRNWFVNDSLVHSGTNPVFNFVNTSHTKDSIISIKLIVEAGTGCKDSTTRQVVIYPQPAAGFSIPDSLCPRSVATPVDTSISKPGYSYRWFVNSAAVGISNDTLAAPQFSFLDNQSGYDSIYTLSLVITSVDGCSDSTSRQVRIYSRPQAQFSLPRNSCGPVSFGPIDNSTGSNLDYRWSVQPTVPVTGSRSSNPSFDFPLSLSDSVEYMVQLFLTDSITGCTDTLSKKFSVYPKPTAAFSASPKDSCGPFTVQFSNLSLPNQSGMDRSSMSFAWDFGNGQTSTDSVPTATFTNTGVIDSVYRVELIATNAFGCSDTTVDSIRVHPDPKVDFTAQPLQACAPFVIDTSVVSYVDYPAANGSYRFQFLDVKTDSLLASFNRYDSLFYSLNQPGDSVKFRMIALSPFGCKSDTGEVIFSTLGSEPIGFTASASEGCHPLVVSLADTGNGFSSWEWYVDGQLVSTLKNPVLSFTNTSTTQDSIYTVKMIAQAGNGCPDSIVQQIRVYAQLEPQFVASGACVGDSLSFQNTTPMPDSVATWVWDFGDGNFDSTASPRHQYAAPGNYGVSLTATSIHGCTYNFSDTATQYPLPLAAFGIDNSCGVDSACANQIVTFFDSSSVASLGGNIVQWQWDVTNDGSIDYTGNQPSHTYTAAGTYQVRMITTSNFGCADTVIRDIHIYEPPQALFVMDSIHECGPFHLSVTDSSRGLIDTYYWELFSLDSAGQRVSIYTSTQSNPNPMPSLLPNWGKDTTYYVELTTGNCCGSTSFLDSITLKSMPVARTVASSSQGCTPFNATFQLDGLVKGQPDYLVMDYGDGSPADTIYKFYQINPQGDTIWVWGQQNHRFVNNGLRDTTFQVAVTAVNDCGDSTAYTSITVHPNNVQAFIEAYPENGCSPLTVTILDRSFGGTSTSWCLDYDTANGTCNLPTAVGDSIVHTYTQPGTYVIAQFVNDMCSGDTAFKTITVFPSPVANFSHSGNVCLGEPVLFSNLSQADSITGYNWNFGDGQQSILKHPSHVYNSPGTYPILLQVTSRNGCYSEYWDTVDVYDAPEMNFSFNNACQNQQPIAFFDSSSVQHGGIMTTFWDFGDGNTSVNSNPTHTYAQPGTYTVKLVHSSTNGCIDSVEKLINIFPVATAQFDPQRVSQGKNCGAPQMYSFINQSQNAAGYYWDFDFNGVRGANTSTLNNPNFLYTKSGVYDVLLVATNSYGCADSIIKQVLVRPVPKAGFEGINISGCAPLTVEFNDTSLYDWNGPGGITGWTWSFGDSSYAYDSPSVTHTYTKPGTYTVSLSVQTDGGCSDSIVLSNYITVLPTPIPDFNNKSLNSKTFKFTNLSKYADENTAFIWDFGDGKFSTERHPTHNYGVDLFENDYEFEVCLITLNQFGCGDTLCKKLNLKGYQLYTANAFAPGLTGVGEASIWRPLGHSLKEYHLKIYDEWGNMVFESTELDESGKPSESWDGRHMANGTELPMGAYVWVIEAVYNDGTIWPGVEYDNGKRKNYGTVTLIR